MHVCFRRDYFNISQKSKGDNLFMVNGFPCKIDGVGMMKILIFDGVVRSLSDVSYVPEMRKNRI